MACVNCGAEVTTKYCPDCGQFNMIKRINPAQMWVDFQGRIYGFDGMFPRTLRDITLRPGQAARSYIAGNRVRYYGPVGYFFLMITLLILLSEILGVDLVKFMKTFAGVEAFQPLAGTGQEKMYAYMIKFIVAYMKIVFFVLIPIQAFAARFIFFRKSGYNYLEHTVLPFYVMGHTYWLTILNLILFSLFGQLMPKIITIVGTSLFYAYAYVDFINNQSKVKAFFKGLGIYFLAMIFFSLISIIVLMIVVYLDPDFMEMMRSAKSP